MSDSLDNFSESELDKAQNKLNSLCEEHGITPFNLHSGKPRWKKLVMNMIGLKTIRKKGGRPQARTEDDNWDIISHIISETTFSPLDDNGNEIRKPKSAKLAIYDAAEKFRDKYELSKEYQSGEKSEAVKTTRGIYYNKFKEMQRKQLEEDYEIDMPEEYYKGINNKKKQEDKK